MTRGNRLQAILLGMVLLFTLAAAPPAVAFHEYDQPVWFNWNTTELDVLVLGIDDPVIGTAIRDAIEAWEVGIADLAPGLADELSLRVYDPGVDPVPPAGFQSNDVEIVFVPQGFYAVHSGSSVCVANAPMLWGWGSYYHVALHEFGHCLGLGHVFSHGNEYSPGFDPMGGGLGGYTSCPSNLNIAVLERVFSGQGGTVTMSASDYEQSDC